MAPVALIIAFEQQRADIRQHIHVDSKNQPILT